MIYINDLCMYTIILSIMLSMRCLIHLGVYVWNTESTPSALKSQELGRSTKDWEVSWSVVVLHLFFNWHLQLKITANIYIYMYHRMIQLKVYAAYQTSMKSWISIHRFNYPLHVYSNFIKFQWLKSEVHSRGMCQIVCRCFFSLKAGEYYLITANLVILFSKAGVSLIIIVW